jgi:hypothetical protein
MKTCESREEQSYVKESEAYTLLQHYDDIRGDEKNNQVAQHLVRLYGSWRIDGKFNLLLEYADKGPLETFFQKVKPPQTAQDFFKFWNSLVQIVKPVGRIHELSGRGTIPSVFQGSV